MLNKNLFLRKTLKDVDVLILAGGKGERLKAAVPDRPKVMALVRGKPFLEILLEKLFQAGFRRVILSVGHLREQIIDYFRDHALARRGFLEIIFSEEDTPLGTGGAVKKAETFISSPHFLVLNGDTFCSVDLADFYQFFLNKKAELTLLLSAVEDNKDGGNVVLDADERVRNFQEKDFSQRSGLVNAGVYLMKREILNLMPDGAFSLEYDFLPKVLANACYGFRTKIKFIDIGTPERYREAQKIFAREEK